MPIIHHHADIQLLVSVRGHPFDRTEFDAMFQDMEGVSATMVDQPAAGRLMNLEDMHDFDALVLYDMPGLDFEHPHEKLGYLDPAPSLMKGFEDLLKEGKGIIALHHALAGWPTWPEYSKWLGGRFLYHPERVNGRETLDSGYAHNINYTAINEAATHPAMQGIPDTFPMCDELYLAEIFEQDVTPLLRADYEFTAQNFYSAAAALNGKMNENKNWHHPGGSNLIGWAKMAINSRLVYLQPGDCSAAYENPHFRQMLKNSIEWVTGKS